jgi:ribosome-binding factor A
MGDGRRVQRVEKELQHIVANYLVRGFKGQLQGLVSVSRVESNPKLRTAKVYISVMGSDEQRETSIDTLQEHAREIQNHVNKQLRMKFVPRLSFVLDQGLQKLLHVESLLREIALNKKPSEDEE